VWTAAAKFHLRASLVDLDRTSLRRPREDWPGTRFAVEKPLRLDSGVDLGPFTIAYQTYGTLNADAATRC
jgi:homoserine O-acetyltransferase